MTDTCEGAVPHGYEGTGSQSSFQQALAWYEDCLQNHEECRIGLTCDNWYPTRLIDVGTESQDFVKLVCKATAGFEFKGRYATLSHRRENTGPADFHLLHGNEIEAQNGIRISYLPKIFQDAIEVTRRFKFQYLWADCLCILQDSPDDREAESTTMSLIYSRSSLNIAATASASYGQGLFREYCVDNRWPWLVNLSYFSGCYIYSMDMLNRELRNSPLLQHALFIQEAFLAPRTLHFAPSKLLWACSHKEACEMVPDEISSKSPGGWVSRKSKNCRVSTVRHRIMNSTCTQELRYQEWDNVVCRFMTCYLSSAHDKLDAISGIARCFSKVVDSDYKAGMWQSRFPGALLWQVVNCSQAGGKPSERIKRQGTPSWSWASLNAVIHMDDMNLPVRIRATMMDIKIEAIRKCGCIFGQLKSGSVKLQGQMLSWLTVVPPTESSPFYNIVDRNNAPAMNITVKPDLGFTAPDRFKVVCFLIQEKRRSLLWDFECLLLIRVNPFESRTFARFGYAELHSTDILMFDPAIGKDRRRELDCSLLQETTVTIV